LKFTASKQSVLFYLVFICTLLLALALRLPNLAQRPMHTDEAVHAVKFGELLQHHSYTYDPFEYHGPTLVYSTLIPAWLRGQKSYADLDEITLRLVPVLYGCALIAILLLLRGILSAPALLFTALFTTVSPAFVFYSRYYIMEMLLVFFTATTIIAAFRFLRTRRLFWALLAGAAIGLMHATKETGAMSWFAMAAALGALLILDRKKTRQLFAGLKWRRLLAGLFAAALVSILFFSSFFSTMHGVIDSIVTFKTYFNRGAGGFHAHIYPWFQYFKWLLYNRHAGRPLWTEGAIFLLAVPGFIAIFSNKNKDGSDQTFVRFIALYTLILTFIYMLIPYKTPWSLLGFYHGFIFIAGVGASHLLRGATKIVKIAVACVLALALLHLGWQAQQLNSRYATDISNPYVYAHTDKDIFRLLKSVDELTFYWPQGRDTFIEVVSPGADYWPLPWYLRHYTHVGYFSDFDYDIASGALIITSPALQAHLLKKLYETPPPGQRDMYVPQFEHSISLRPGVPLELYVRKDVWDEWYRNKP